MGWKEGSWETADSAADVVWVRRSDLGGFKIRRLKTLPSFRIVSQNQSFQYGFANWDSACRQW
jgi:hypothetical protein